MSLFIKAMLLVVVAEMGDKTQLLAIAMASKYKASKVMIGVFIATVLNHALAVMVGNYLNRFIDFNIIKIVAGISFLIFGLWTIRGDSLDEEENKKSKFGPIVTVAIAFFIAEMGDKTQLMTIAIAAESSKPLFILMGTTVGMLIADGIGILGGAWLAKNVSPSLIKWIAGIVFLIFGTLSLHSSLPSQFITPLNMIVYFICLVGLSFVVKRDEKLFG